MPDGFKNNPNPGATKADLERGFSKPCEKDMEQGMIMYADSLEDEYTPFHGGFCGRPMGWER